MDKSNDRPAVIPPDVGRAHEIAPDALPCPDWCAEPWHADLRLWSLDNGHHGTSGVRICTTEPVRVASKKISMVIAPPGGVRWTPTDPIKVSTERFQSFDVTEAARGFGVLFAYPPTTKVLAIHWEDHLHPDTVAGLIEALQQQPTAQH